ncbi:MAG TPA: hypothetical protein VMF70_14740 [Gemmatimonadales bacterium]|nr:hypothetical protein [Gemmatimonadales bacterium]
MTQPIAREHSAQTNPAVPQRGLELPAAVAMSWSLATGMLLGGAAVVAMIATDRMSGHLLLLGSAVLFAIGAAVGLVHGVILGIAGRPEGTTPRQAVGAMLHGLFYYPFGLLLSWAVAGWVAAMPLALLGHHVIGTVISALAWVAMAATAYFAGSTGLHALTLAYRRWPDRVPGTIMVGATLVALLVAFAIQPPTIWFTDVRLTYPGAVVLALGATFWFYGPIITAGLAVLRRAMPLFPASRVLDRVHASKGIALRAGLAIGAGILVAALAAPFHKGALGLPTDVERVGFLPAMGLAVANAVTDELFLRLFVFTAALALAVRLLPKDRTWAVWLAIGVATVADLLLHWPDMTALGLPGLSTTLAYAVARMAIPAVLFGYLYWRRGLGTAVAAHAAAGAAVGLLAL